MNSSTWLGRFVAFGLAAAAVVACSSSSKDTGGEGDASTGTDGGTVDGSPIVDSGSDASPNNRVTNDAGACVSNCHEGDPCTAPAQCASGICTADACVEPSCTDGVLDGTETAPDCGGTCSACADGLACIIGADCQSGVCDPTSKTCAVPTSTDSVKNGNETGVDCGSSGTGTNTNAPPCGDGQGCNDAADCADKQCGVNKTCTPASCGDGILNGTETGLDCGGLCNPCVDGLGCKVDADCSSKSCDVNGSHLCLAPTDTDTITNGNETDVDCGSSGTNDGGENTHAPTCGDDKSCNVGTDCTDGVCDPTAKTCSAPTCKDGVQNGGETGIDCGYSIITLCPACGDGLGCGANSDCTSLNCDTTKTHKCLAPTDTDGIANGNETDVDCGSSATGENTKAPACPDINATTKTISRCGAGTDCKSGFCNATEKQCVDGQSCSLPAVASATGIKDISVEATATSDAQGVANTNGAGLYAGIDTCGVGEATDSPGPNRKLESCCKSLDVAVAGEGTIRVDKYEVTSGRMRQFIEAVNAQAAYSGYNLQKYVFDQFNAAGAPTTAVGTVLAAEIPTIQSGVTDTRYLFPSGASGALNVVEQLGGTSIDAGVPSDLQGCFVGPGAAGASTYWFDLAMSAVVGSPPRNFTQDYYDIKSQNCAPYWMAAAFCAWDGGHLPSNAEMDVIWGTSTYPWGPTSRNFQDLGGDSTWQSKGYPTITGYTIDNLNDYPGGYFYTYPASNGESAANPSNPATGPLGYASITDTIDSTGQPARLLLSDFTPYIASPGRFTQDITSLTATGIYAGDAWYDVAANLFEFKALPASSFNSGGIFCDTTAGPTISTQASCPAVAGYVTCSRGDYADGSMQFCGVVRGSGATSAPVSKMPGIRWQGGSWEVHSIPTGGNPNNENNYVEPMEAQYGKTGFRCVRNAE